MDRFKNILVTSGVGSLDAPALRAAVELADDNEARLTLLDVVEPLPRWQRSIKVGDRSVNVQELLLRDRTARLRTFVELAGGEPQVTVETRTGKASVEVIRHVLAHGCDLVVVGEPAPAKEGASGVSAGVMQLLRKCPVPVWAMRPSAVRRRKVLALVDPDPADRVRNGLNHLVLTLAASLARRHDGELHVAHAWSLPGGADLSASSYMLAPGMQMSSVWEAVAEEHRVQLDALVEQHGIVETGGEVHLVKGEPGRALPALATRLDVGVIVMGTVARTGLSGLVMGNTAETILRAVSCSVMAVKPEGFVSPVRLEGRSQKTGER